MAELSCRFSCVAFSSFIKRELNGLDSLSLSFCVFTQGYYQTAVSIYHAEIVNLDICSFVAFFMFATIFFQPSLHEVAADKAEM